MQRSRSCVKITVRYLSINACNLVNFAQMYIKFQINILETLRFMKMKTNAIF